jgi:glycosyltransferase involved in cell wall biosynthesis
VIGDGPERSALEAKAKMLGISSRVSFTGWLPSLKEVAQAVASGKVFAMNSKSEGGPRAALEAMSYGVPVLSTKVGVMPEVISDGDNGIFTDGTSEDLAVKIDMLLKDQPRREALGKEAMKVIEKFEKKKLIKEYADFLKGMLS